MNVFSDINNPLPERTPESSALANKALGEMMNTGKVSTICPKCLSAPTVTLTEHGQRTVIVCKCRYIYSIEINL
ncbi:MAG: hypothetical protein IJQ37_06185 [Clostridia bacterium]|nr:hypothetical protein [Clostridia bacterium]